MSERGTFTTSFIYNTTDVTDKIEEIFNDSAGWAFAELVTPYMVAGRISGHCPGEELHKFKTLIAPRLREVIEGEIHVAVICDSGESEVYRLEPKAPEFKEYYSK